MYLFRNHDENEIGRLVPDFFLFFKKDLYAVKVKSSAAWFQYVSVVLSLVYRKNKLYKTWSNRSGDMFKFGFFEEVLGIISPPHFCVWFFNRNVSHAIFY